MSSLVSDFDLVCDRAYTIPLLYSISSVSVFVGSTLAGILSDKIGRKKTMIVSAISGVMCSAPLPFITVWWVYGVLVVLKFTCYQFGYIAAAVYTLELFGPTKEHYAITVSLGFSVGYAFISLTAWTFPNWRHLAICNTLMSCLMVSFITEYPL